MGDARHARSVAAPPLPTADVRSRGRTQSSASRKATGVRVGVNASVVGENPTGLGIYSVKLVEALDQRLDDLVVYTSSREAFPSLGARLRRAPVRARPDYGMRGHLVRALWIQTVLRLKCRVAGVRVLLNTVPEGLIQPSLPQITVVHDLLPLLFPEEYPRQRHYFGVLVPRVLRASAMVVADSESSRRQVHARYGVPLEKIRTVHPAYDARMFARHPGDDAPQADGIASILFVGNLLPHKNVLRLLDAVAILRRRHPCRLVIRGHGRPSYVRAVRARVAAHGLGDAVTFLDDLTEPELRRLYTQAQCFVLPSLGEGFGMPVLEAMACGTPVVTSDVPALREVAADAALFVDPHDAESIADAMYRVLSDRALREDLRERGLRRAAAFSWSRTGAEMAQVIAEVARA